MNDTIKYKFEIDDAKILNRLNSIQDVLKGTKDIITELKKTFETFSSKTFASELNKLKNNENSSTVGSWGSAKENLKISLKNTQNNNTTDFAILKNLQQSLTDYSTVGNNAFGTGIGQVVGLVKMFEDIADINLFGGVEDRKKAMDSLLTTILDSSKATSEFATNMLNSYDAITQSLTKETLLIDNHKELVNELKTITDENGNVKAGYEARAQFIVSTLNNAYDTEMELVNGTIKNYKDEVESIEDVIAKKKQEIALNISGQQYQLALETKVETYKNLVKAEKEHNLALSEQERIEKAIEEQFKNGKAKKGESLEEFTKRMISENEEYQRITNAAIKTQESLKLSQDAYDANVQARMNYQALQTAIANGDAEAVDYYTNKISNSYYDGKNMMVLTQAEMLDETKRYHDGVYEMADESNLKIADSLKSGADYALESTKNSLLEQTTSLESLTPNVIDAWGALSKGSTDRFLEYFNEIPNDLKQDVISKMEAHGYEISSELEEGLRKNNPKIHIKSEADSATILIDADTKQAEKKTNNWLKEVIGTVLGGAWILKKEQGGIYSNGSWTNIPQYANGGLPNHGTMFIAGESGAEIVGHINGRTEVLNKSQIASAIYTAVATAMSEYSGTNQDIRVYAEEGLIVEKVSKGINQHVKQTGNLPFTIPV